MRTNAPLTIASVTPRLSKVADSAAVVTIRSIFSGKSLDRAESVAEFSKLSSAERAAGPKIDNAARTCVTICKSRSKKPRLAPKKKSKFESWIFATNATATARKRARARSVARLAEVAARESARADFSRARKLARDVEGWAK